MLQGEFEDAIKEDLAMIEINFDKVVHTSDHFAKIQEYTEKLIRQGDAFMDDTDGETVSFLQATPHHPKAYTIRSKSNVEQSSPPRTAMRR